MKKFSLLLLVTLSSALLITGCGKDKEPETITETVVDEHLDTSEEIAESNTPGLPPEEGMVRSPLTNQWVNEEVASLRPLAVMIPNEKGALPHYNLSNADILYECLVEEQISRLMAIYGDWTNLERIGNLRSCRDYYIYWAFEWDAIYVHAGGPFYINDVIRRSDTQNIDALTAPSGVFYRTTDRSAPHNLYLDGKNIYDEANRLGYPLETRAGYSDPLHFQFTTETNPNTLEQYSDSKAVKKIDLARAYPVSQTWFEYNEDDGLYYRYQKISDGPHMDAATNSQLAFKNVLVQFTYYEVRDARDYLAFQCIDNTRDGWYFTNGRGIHVTWRKTSDYGATRYFDDNGNEIQLNTGKTMICIVQDGDEFVAEN